MSGQTVIVGGVGEPNRAKVGSNFGLATNSITETIVESVTIAGGGFNVATSPVTLTNTAESALFYIKNNEKLPILVTSVFINTNKSVGTLTGGQPVVCIYRNPKSGSIISSAKEIVPTNSNFGSFESLAADAYEGAQGDAFGDNQGIISVPLPSRAVMPLAQFDTQVVLPNGASYGISYHPEAGSTSVDMIVGLTVIKLPEDFV